MTEDIGEHVCVEELTPNPKTRRWVIKSRHHDDLLGTVSWSGSWRCYVLVPERDTIFSAGCLRDIAKFLRVRTSVHRGGDRP